MTKKDFDDILDELYIKIGRKRDIDLIKANEEIKAINRAYDAYLDGIYDAVKLVKMRMEKNGEYSEGKR